MDCLGTSTSSGREECNSGRSGATRRRLIGEARQFPLRRQIYMGALRTLSIQQELNLLKINNL